MCQHHQASGRCPYCGKTFSRITCYSIDMLRCDGCHGDFVVNCTVVTRKIEGEEARITEMTNRRNLSRSYCQEAA